MEQKRPRSREKRVTSGGKGVFRRGEGLGTGPVGGGSSSGQGGRGGSGGRSTRSGGKRSPMSIILLLVLLLGGGGGGLSALLGGGQSGITGTQAGTVDTTPNVGFSSFLGGGTVSSGWEDSSNLGKLDTTVAEGSRAKYTQIYDNRADVVTIMVYMCGTDLESRNSMGTADLQEMLQAEVGDNVNLLVYTGGCNSWRNNVVSSSVNQIYQIKDGQMCCLLSDAGKVSMTDPDTLTGFIRWSAANFPANRNMLIFWDHGGGSISGYGYDEKFARSGSMDLAEIDQALKAGGVKFDFVGFDACLMATLETALMTSQYSDYLIASEETEPGVGWYYTNWLTKLSANTAMPTIEIGKNIVDDFVDVCAQQCRGQQTTLSVVDLAELETTVPQQLKDFSQSTSQLIQEKSYQTVANARNNAREFAQSSKIDQVDLVHLAKNMGTEESEALAKALLGTVKYNRTSTNMTNAYGLSIYFPYQKASNVDQAVATYQQIGMDDEYARCIQEFASLEVSGQVSTGGTTSPLPALLGTLSGSSAGSSSELIAQMLGSFLTGNMSSISGLSSGNTGFLSGRALSTQEMADYLAANQLDASALVWQPGEDGVGRITLTEEQWELVHGLELNMFYDDGQGYIDLGLDNVFTFDAQGALLGHTDGTWLAINGQPVAYYHLNTVDDGENYTITGRVPVMLNGERADLILVFDNENPYGFIAGARTNYANGQTETVAKNMTGLQVGDTLDFLCDYYGYDGSYQDSYYLGEPMVVEEEMHISNVDVGADAVRATYRFTDLYNQHYWTEPIS